MRVDIISVLPELLEGPLGHSIIKRARDQKRVLIQIHALREFSNHKHRKVDDYPYGGGAGMVLMCEPLSRCIEHLTAQRKYDEIIFMTPDGTPADQKRVNSLSLKEHIMIICGHYKGIDQRIRDLYVTREISIGNFVVTGGEIPAAMLVDGIVRLLPGVLGNEESALSDSFQDNLLAPPVYTRPESFKGLNVPPVLLCGDPAKIEAWRLEQSEKRTQRIRPDLLSD